MIVARARAHVCVGGGVRVLDDALLLVAKGLHLNTLLHRNCSCMNYVCCTIATCGKPLNCLLKSGRIQSSALGSKQIPFQSGRSS
jgi:hypothetical protein